MSFYNNYKISYLLVSREEKEKTDKKTK